MASFISKNILEILVIFILLCLLTFLIKRIKFSKLIRKTIESNHSLYHFARDSQDENTYRRLTTAVVNDIKKFHPEINIKRIEFRVKFEVNAKLKPATNSDNLLSIKTRSYTLNDFYNLINTFICSFHF